MIIVFPYFINDFFSLLELPLFYKFFNQDYRNAFNFYSDIYFNNLNDFVDSIYEDYKFLKVTLDLENIKNINVVYYNSILKLDELISKNVLNNIYNKIVENSELIRGLINNFNVNELNSNILKQELMPKIDVLLKNITKLIDFYNNVSEILNIQKKLSPIPFVDKFLKMYFTYIQNIRDLSNYPVDTLLNLILKNVSFINTLEKNYTYIINLIKRYLENEGIKDQNLTILINYYEGLLDFVNAIKYSIGGIYQIITGNIDKLDKNEVELLFIQINQASNGLFQKQIELQQFINDNFETPFDLYLLFFKALAEYKEKYKEEDIQGIVENIITEFNNFILVFFSNPLVYYNFDREPKSIYEKIIYYVDNHFFFDIKKINGNKLNEIIEILEYYKKFYIRKDFFGIGNPEADNFLKNISEILIIYNLFVNHNVTYTTFFNLFKNVFSFVNLYKVFSLSDSIGDNLKFITLLEDKFNYLYDLIYYENIFYSFYVNFYNSKIDYYKFIFELSYLVYEIIYLLRDLLISFYGIINTKFKCPKCFTDNNYLNLKCSNCGFTFPFNPTKLLVNNIINANPLVWGYVLSLIDSIFYIKNKELTLDLLYNSIDNFSNFVKNIDISNVNDEKLKSNYFAIEKINEILKELYNFIETETEDFSNLENYFEEIILKISKLVDISKDLKLN